jgi:hypothetical protein
VKRARVALTAGVAVLAAIGIVAFSVELVRNRFVQDPIAANYVTLPLGATLVALAIGTVIAVRRPAAPVGWVLGAAGATTGLAYWWFSTHPWMAAGGFVLLFGSALLPLHAAVVQGEGVSPRVRRMLVGATGVLTVLGIGMVLTLPPGALDRWFVAADPERNVDNMFQLFEARDVAHTLHALWWCVLLGAASVATAARLRRWRAAPRRIRRTEAPPVIAALVWVAATAATGLITFVDRTPGAREAIADFAAIALPAMTLAFISAAIGWVELVEPRLTRRDGTVELRDLEHDRAGVRAMLADLLATPRVDLAYATESGWVDDQGRVTDIVSERRTTTIVRVDGDPVAAILHDRDVPVDAVQLGARLTAAQLAAEGATALARARAEAVRSATAELVRAGDRASLVVTNSVLRGPVPELVDLANRLRADTATLATAGDELRTITGQVRELSHGLLPRDLEQEGLPAVLDGRVHLDRRLPDAIEITVYLLAYDDPDAEVRDRGDMIVVTRTSAPGAEAAARVSALGGSIDGTVAIVPAA